MVGDTDKRREEMKVGRGTKGCKGGKGGGGGCQRLDLIVAER